MIDKKEAPAGFYAVKFTSCRHCAAFNDSKLCYSPEFRCAPDVREDGQNVIFHEIAGVKSQFMQSAESRKTSPEIMRAIMQVAGGDEDRAKSIWLDPDEESFLEIYSIVTKSGIIDSTAFIWGGHGDQWGYL